MTGGWADEEGSRHRRDVNELTPSRPPPSLPPSTTIAADQLERHPLRLSPVRLARHPQRSHPVTLASDLTLARGFTLRAASDPTPPVSLFAMLLNGFEAGVRIIGPGGHRVTEYGAYSKTKDEQVCWIEAEPGAVSSSYAWRTGRGGARVLELPVRATDALVTSIVLSDV